LAATDRWDIVPLPDLFAAAAPPGMSGTRDSNGSLGFLAAELDSPAIGFHAGLCYSF
jgi:hypothetical protein